MKTETIPQRYFIYDFETDLMDVELVEVSKEIFDTVEGDVTTERHTVFENGVNQICHTKENY